MVTTPADGGSVGSQAACVVTACPNAILILNEYNVIEYSSEHGEFIDLVKTVPAS